MLYQHEHLHEHGGRAHLQHFGEYRGRNGHADDTRRLLALDEPPQHDARLDHLRDHRGAARPLDAEPLVAQGQDEQRGQHQVEDGASSHDGHGPRQLAFAAHDHVRALREVHEQAADEHDAQVGFGQVEDLPLCAGEGQQRAREHRADDRDGTRFMTTRLPITWSMVRWSFAPMARDSTEADPMPIIEAPPELMNVNG